MWTSFLCIRVTAYSSRMVAMLTCEILMFPAQIRKVTLAAAKSHGSQTEQSCFHPMETRYSFRATSFLVGLGQIERVTSKGWTRRSGADVKTIRQNWLELSKRATTRVHKCRDVSMRSCKMRTT